MLNSILYAYNGEHRFYNKDGLLEKTLPSLVYYLYASSDMREFGSLSFTGVLNIDVVTRFNVIRSY